MRFASLPRILGVAVMHDLGFVGFGEAGAAFARGMAGERLRAYDIKLDGAARADMAAQMRRLNVAPCAPDQLEAAEAVFCLVTADQALAAATLAAPHLAQGALWLDGNSCAPSTKRAACAVISAAGGAYVDVAIMAPVHPRGAQTPLLISGPNAARALALLNGLGMNARNVGGAVGDASTIKMLRSVIVKGLEALTAEAFLAARAAGVDGAVIASLQASDGGIDWQARGAHNLERMLLHGARRSAEMIEVAKCLRDLGLPDRMSAAAAQWQAQLADLDIDAGEDAFGPRADAVLGALAGARA